MMYGGIWDRHSHAMEETSATEKERISATYHSDGENGGTSLQQLGDKELKSSISYTDVSVDSAYTSSNKLSSEYFSSCQDRSCTDSGKACSLDSHPSETSCDEELLDSEETVNGPSVICRTMDKEFKLLDEWLTQGNNDFQHIVFADEEVENEYLTPETTSTPTFSANKDGNLYFQRNYTIFKEHMEPSSKLMDEIISSECRDKSFPERIREAPTRQRKADILIKYAARYLDKDSFESLLKRTEHGHLIQKLKTGSSQEACMPTASEFENMIHLLCNKEFKELLMDEIEPRLIIDRLVEHEVLSFDDHEDVLVTDYRPTRVESLMKYINRNHERNCIYFFMVLKESYPYLIHQFDTCDIVSGCEDTSNLDITTMNGGWRLPQTFSVDESAELKFHVRLSPSCPDVEMSIVDESETNMDVEYNMKLLDLQLESMQLGSIVIVHKQLTAHAIQKLQEACSTGEIKRYIRSLFRGKDVEQLKRDGVTFLVLKITAEKSQVKQKLFKPMKITQEATCVNDRNVDSVIPAVHGSFTDKKFPDGTSDWNVVGISQDTTWMVTGRKLHENASFLLDELEPKEYVKAFDSILSQDVQCRLISDLDRRERAKLFLDEIVEKGQPAVEIFICELDRLGRHHILNILSGTNTSGFNADRIAHQIRNSIVKYYSVFIAELEPKIIGAFFVERRLLDNALYEKICQLPSRRNRVVTFLKWLLDEERPDAYFTFQNAVKMFYSEKFVKLLETTDPLSTSGISSRAADQTNDAARTHVLFSRAADQTNDVARTHVLSSRAADQTNDVARTHVLSSRAADQTNDVARTHVLSSRAADQTNDVARTHVLLYLARFKITFTNDTSSSTQSAKRETFSERATEYKSDESGMVLWPLSSSEKETDLRDIVCKFQEIKGSGISIDTDLKSNFSLEEQTESLVARGSDPSRCGSSVSSGSIKPTDMNIVLDSTHYIPFKRIPRKLKVAEWLLNMDTARMSKTCEDYQVVLSSPTSRSTSSASGERQNEMMRATNDDTTPDQTNQASNKNSMLSDLTMTEEDKKLASNDFPPNRNGEPRLLNAKTLSLIQNTNISSRHKVAKWLSEQCKKSSTKDCFSIPEKTSTSYIDPDKQFLMENTSAESGETQDLLTIEVSAICKCHSQIVSDQDSGFSKSRRDASEVSLPPDKSNSNTNDDISKSDLGYRSNSDHSDIDQMTTSSFTSSGLSTMSLKSRECSSHLSEYKCIDDVSLFDPLSQRCFIKLQTMMPTESLTVREIVKLKRKRIFWDSGSRFVCSVCQRWNDSVELHMDTCNLAVHRVSSDATSHVVCCYCPRMSP